MRKNVRQPGDRIHVNEVVMGNQILEKRLVQLKVERRAANRAKRKSKRVTRLVEREPPGSMASKKVADSTLYHLSPKGFWKKFRDVAVTDPNISSGLPLATLNRNPQPASRPEVYSTPATKASDPAQNPYWKRDVRRAYPQLSTITQAELSTLLVQGPEFQPISGPTEGTTTITTSTPKKLDLSEAIAVVTSSKRVYSESQLPPKLPTPYARWIPERSPDAPHAPHSYFPMNLYK